MICLQYGYLEVFCDIQPRLLIILRKFDCDASCQCYCRYVLGTIAPIVVLFVGRPCLVSFSQKNVRARSRVRLCTLYVCNVCMYYRGQCQHGLMCGCKQCSNDINESKYNAAHNISIRRKENDIMQIDLPDGSTKLSKYDEREKCPGPAVHGSRIIFVGVRTMLGTILGPFSIIYFGGQE